MSDGQEMMKRGTTGGIQELAAEMQAEMDEVGPAVGVSDSVGGISPEEAERRAKELYDPKGILTSEQIAAELTARGEGAREAQVEFDKFQEQREKDLQLKNELMGIGKGDLLPEDVKQRLAQDGPPNPATWPHERDLAAKPLNPVIDEKTGEQLLDEDSEFYPELRGILDNLTELQEDKTAALLERYPQLLTFMATSPDRTEAALAVYQIFRTIEEHNAELNEREKRGINVTDQRWTEQHLFEMLGKIRPYEEWGYSLMDEGSDADA